MKDLFSGLLLYEITLLILGVILFLILSAGLLYYIIKKEQIKKLLLFFLLPILMIGYPSIKEISVSKDRIALVKYQDMLITNPEDSVAREKVEEYTGKLEERASTTDDMVRISKSNLLLGNSREAAYYANKALDKDSTHEQARDLKKLVSVQETLKEQLQATDNPEREETIVNNMMDTVKVVQEYSNLKPFLMQNAGSSSVSRLRNP